MRISLCNEVLRELPFPAQCDMAAALGYDGLEIAPFTLAENPLRLGAQDIAAVRRALKDAGLTASSLHWLLVAPAGLSISDPAADGPTRNAISRLCGLAGELAAPVLVHGSPEQRRTGGDPARRDQARRMLSFAAEEATRADVVYCIEPLARDQTDFVNTLDEAGELVRQIDRPNFRTMLDCAAASATERLSLAALATEGLDSGLIAHVQVNDQNRRGPGEGDTKIAPLLEALTAKAYDGWVAVEPFIYRPDGPACAARAIGYLRGLLDKAASAAPNA